MKAIYFSRLVHFLALLSFITPFFFNACSHPTKAELEVMQKTKEDSIEKSLKSNHTFKDSVSSPIMDAVGREMPTDTTITVADKADSLKITSTETTSYKYKENKKDSMLADMIASKYPFLKIILVPGKDSVSGLGTVLNNIHFISFFGTSFSLLLLFVGLLMKYLDKNALKSVLLIHLLNLAFLSCSQTLYFETERLWGFWLCLALSSIVTLYDAYLLIAIRKKIYNND